MSLFFPPNKYDLQIINTLPTKTSFPASKLQQIGKYMHTLYTALNIEDYNKLIYNLNSECYEPDSIVSTEHNYFVIYTYFTELKNYLIFAHAGTNKEYNTKCSNNVFNITTNNDSCKNDVNDNDDNDMEQNIFQYQCYEISRPTSQFKNYRAFYTRNNIINTKVFYNVTDFEQEFDLSNLEMVAHGHWEIKNDSFVYLGTHIITQDYINNKQDFINFYLVKHLSNYETKWGMNTIKQIFKNFNIECI